MEKEYISIREFAARANISKQRVYQLLEKKLKPYCKTIENKKCVDVSALEEFQRDSNLENIIQPIEKVLESSLKKNSESTENSNFQPLERAIENIIESFNKQLETKDKQINELTEMLKDVQSKQNELMCSLKAAQALHAGTIQEHIE